MSSPSTNGWTGRIHEGKPLQERRPLHTILNTQDFEDAASEILSEKAWAFFSSAATDYYTYEANRDFFRRIWLRPRVLRDITTLDVKTKILGNDVSFPLFVSPAAMAKLAHPDGELAIARATTKAEIAHTISTNASYPLAEITAIKKGHPFFLQLYVNKNRAASESILKNAEQNGCVGVFLTVDQSHPGKREYDERVKFEDESLMSAIPTGAAPKNDIHGSGIGRTMADFIDCRLNWNDIAWLRSVTKMPIIIKGVQTAEDAMLAAEHGVDGLLIGNHGGRSLDTATPAIMILLELRKRCPQIFDRVEIFVDGGIRRGTDIFKALCLGAKAVGMGRHFMYAACYGEEGVSRLIDIMKDEFETTMKLMGCTKLSQLHPGLLNLYEVDHWFSESRNAERQESSHAHIISKL
ncbi:hypothetical protein V2G26_004455 [Clonostachys chloroleuca]